MWKPCFALLSGVNHQCWTCVKYQNRVRSEQEVTMLVGWKEKRWKWELLVSLFWAPLPPITDEYWHSHRLRVQVALARKAPLNLYPSLCPFIHQLVAATIGPFHVTICLPVLHLSDNQSINASIWTSAFFPSSKHASTFRHTHTNTFSGSIRLLNRQMTTKTKKSEATWSIDGGRRKKQLKCVRLKKPKYRCHRWPQ